MKIWRNDRLLFWAACKFVLELLKICAFQEFVEAITKIFSIQCFMLRHGLHMKCVDTVGILEMRGLFKALWSSKEPSVPSNRTKGCKWRSSRFSESPSLKKDTFCCLERENQTFLLPLDLIFCILLLHQPAQQTERPFWISDERKWKWNGGWAN